MILVIDNEDSFTWNLIHQLEQNGGQVEFADGSSLRDVHLLHSRYSGLLLGPGPGHPDDVPQLHLIFEAFRGVKPVLGVCLGLQIIARAFGAQVVPGRPVHGHASPVQLGQHQLFADIQSPAQVGRYHSLQVTASSLPPELDIIASGDDGSIQGLAHRHLHIAALQFHPESVLTTCRDQLGLNIVRYLDGDEVT